MGGPAGGASDVFATRDADRDGWRGHVEWLPDPDAGVGGGGVGLLAGSAVGTPTAPTTTLGECPAAWSLSA